MGIPRVQFLLIIVAMAMRQDAEHAEPNLPAAVEVGKSGEAAVSEEGAGGQKRRKHRKRRTYRADASAGEAATPGAEAPDAPLLPGWEVTGVDEASISMAPAEPVDDRSTGPYRNTITERKQSSKPQRCTEAFNPPQMAELWARSSKKMSRMPGEEILIWNDIVGLQSYADSVAGMLSACAVAYGADQAQALGKPFPNLDAAVDELLAFDLESEMNYQNWRLVESKLDAKISDLEFRYREWESGFDEMGSITEAERSAQLTRIKQDVDRAVAAYVLARMMKDVKKVAAGGTLGVKGTGPPHVLDPRRALSAFKRGPRPERIAYVQEKAWKLKEMIQKSTRVKRSVLHRPVEGV
jgi:hypothetical protein